MSEFLAAHPREALALVVLVVVLGLLVGGLALARIWRRPSTPPLTQQLLHDDFSSHAPHAHVSGLPPAGGPVGGAWSGSGESEGIAVRGRRAHG